jgi:hypothetical protein
MSVGDWIYLASIVFAIGLTIRIAMWGMKWLMRYAVLAEEAQERGLGKVVNAKFLWNATSDTKKPLEMINATGTGRVVGVQVIGTGPSYARPGSSTMAPPPKALTPNLEVQTVRLKLGVVEGKRYLLESSKDLLEWVSQGEFTATADTETRDFNATEAGQYFRIRELP